MAAHKLLIEITERLHGVLTGSQAKVPMYTARQVVKLPGLRAARLRALLTQVELAEKAGVSRRTVHHIENGGEALTSTVRKLAAALDVQPADLMDD